ncbi:MAG: HD domain-containing protein [Cyclobacterium sp.]|uniref:HD domain-containing protein n=1 Tax=unclassified Cyclobacterium TaxID=2615055 RepID=UPI0013D52560|nr:HD domain-containing protein [Cyclobacterium sp. SYSU L10401]
MTQFSSQAKIDAVFGLYESYGNADYIGEPVSQMEHMCQAAQLAEQEGYGVEVILAAFFHDLGHLFAQQQELDEMDGFGVLNHEKLGAEYLRELGFPELIAFLVESHVAAKRYLTYKDPAYYSKLSEASKQTLKFQGGVMTAAEAKAFETDTNHKLVLKLREWDEKAKITGLPLPDLEKYREMARVLLERYAG